MVKEIIQIFFHQLQELEDLKSKIYFLHFLKNRLKN